MNNGFFLAKSGKVHGPYTIDEIEKIRMSGRYESYTWFWDPVIESWAPIDPPPAPPTLAAPVTQSMSAAPATAAKVSEAVRGHYHIRHIHAVCFDQSTAAAGRLESVSEAGCILSVGGGSASQPEFQTQLPVLLHLFDAETARSMKVPGKIGHVERKNGEWRYRIHWKRCPELIPFEPVATGGLVR